MTVIGITGPTGSGKTTFLSCVRQRGGLVLDLDQVYHALLETDQNLLAALDSRFPGVVRDGVLDRKALGTIVFADPQALKDLNDITARFVPRETVRRLRAAEREGCALAAIDAINLLEGDLPDRCRCTVAVIAPPEIRVRRLMERDRISEEYARLRISAQPPGEYYAGRCDFTLINDGSRERFQQQCQALLDRILAESAGNA